MSRRANTNVYLFHTTRGCVVQDRREARGAVVLVRSKSTEASAMKTQDRRAYGNLAWRTAMRSDPTLGFCLRLYLESSGSVLTQFMTKSFNQKENS
jgi:hypothetical protein